MVRLMIDLNKRMGVRRKGVGVHSKINAKSIDRDRLRIDLGKETGIKK